MNYHSLKYLKYLTYMFLAALMLVSCECGTRHSEVEVHQEKARSSREDRIQATRDFLAKERKSIEDYMKDRELDMQRSGTGLYYEILNDSVAHAFVETEDMVEFEYEIYLMNGSLLYSSRESGTRHLKIDKEDAVIGLHESLKMLGLGDKGRFILPSHLAFGVAGDQNKVPPVTPLVYELKVVKIDKSKS